ncbi:hypothetical protein PMAYCL1PPCAC_09702, partial [Pristionchus mayeri]
MRVRAVREDSEREQKRLKISAPSAHPEATLPLAGLHRALALNLPQDLVVTARQIDSYNNIKDQTSFTHPSFPFSPAPRKKSSERMAPARSFLRYLGVSGTSQTMNSEKTSGGIEERRRGES